jgi:uncharacterized protein
MDSSLYFGQIRHRRFAAASHEFTYPLFMAFLGIDRIPEVMGRSRLSSYNWWNWASFDERDHFGDPQIPLAQPSGRRRGRARTIAPGRPDFFVTAARARLISSWPRPTIHPANPTTTGWMRNRQSSAATRSATEP